MGYSSNDPIDAPPSQQQLMEDGMIDEAGNPIDEAANEDDDDDDDNDGDDISIDIEVD